MTRIALILAAGILCGCDKGTPPVPGNSSGDPIAVAAAVAISDDAKSAHFDAVLEKLDLGGGLFGYVDIDGDVERFIKSISGLYDEVSDAIPGPDGDELPDVDGNELLKEFGLHGIKAFGASSYEADKWFHNKAFLYVPDGRLGLLKFSGAAPAPISAVKLAPAGADILVEYDVQIRALRDMADGIVGKLGMPQIEDGWKELKAGNFPGLPVTVGEFFEKANGRVSFVAKIVPGSPLPLPPEMTNGREFPSIDALLCLENTGWLFDELKEGLTSEGAPFVLSEDAEGIRLTMQMPPDGSMGIYEPQIFREANGERVFIVTRPAFLDECLKGTERISGDAEFKNVTEGLPTEGNGFSYVSKETFALLKSAVEFGMESMGDNLGAGPGFSSMRQFSQDTFGFDRQFGSASITTNLPDGILYSSKDIQSHKGLALVGVTSVAIAASVAVPVYSTIQSRASGTKGLAQLKMLHLALAEHAIDNDGLFPDSLDDLDLSRSGLPGPMVMHPLTGQFVKPLYRRGLNNGSRGNIVILAMPPPSPNGDRAVVCVDGSARMVPENEAMLLIDGMEP